MESRLKKLMFFIIVTCFWIRYAGDPTTRVCFLFSKNDCIWLSTKVKGPRHYRFLSKPHPSCLSVDLCSQRGGLTLLFTPSLRRYRGESWSRHLSYMWRCYTGSEREQKGTRRHILWWLLPSLGTQTMCLSYQRRVRKTSRLTNGIFLPYMSSKCSRVVGVWPKKSSTGSSGLHPKAYSCGAKQQLYTAG